MMSLQFLVVVVVLSIISQSSAFNALKVRSVVAPTRSLTMKVENDAFAKANRSQRRAAADDRMVELRMPMGMDLDEDANGNVFVKSIEKGGRAEKSGMIFVGDIVAMVSATFGDDMWSARGVGLDRVVSSIKVRNSKPVRLVLEAANEQEEKKRRAIAFREATEEEKKALQIKQDALLADMMIDDKELGNKRKFFGLF